MQSVVRKMDDDQKIVAIHNIDRFTFILLQRRQHHKDMMQAYYIHYYYCHSFFCECLGYLWM